MLALTRRQGEQIVVGDDVVVTVVAVGPGRIRLGIEAPSTTPIHRREILLDLEEQAILEHASAD